MVSLYFARLCDKKGNAMLMILWMVLGLAAGAGIGMAAAGVVRGLPRTAEDWVWY